MSFFILLGVIASIVLAKLIVKAIGRYSQSKVAKYVAITAFVLIPTWDIIPGELYFAYVCKQQAGTKIFKIDNGERGHSTFSSSLGRCA